MNLHGRVQRRVVRDRPISVGKVLSYSHKLCIKSARQRQRTDEQFHHTVGGKARSRNLVDVPRLRSVTDLPLGARFRQQEVDRVENNDAPRNRRVGCEAQTCQFIDHGVDGQFQAVGCGDVCGEDLDRPCGQYFEDVRRNGLDGATIVRGFDADPIASNTGRANS